MSHYYLLPPKKLEQALEQHCASWPTEISSEFRKAVMAFLDGQTSRTLHLRIDIPDLVPQHVGVAGEKK